MEKQPHKEVNQEIASNKKHLASCAKNRRKRKSKKKPKNNG